MLGAYIPPEQREAAMQPQEIEIYGHNVDAVRVFCACATQWQTDMAGPLGLSYPAVESVMRMMRIDDPPDCFARVQVLESEALTVWRQQAKKQQARSRA